MSEQKQLEAYERLIKRALESRQHLPYGSVLREVRDGNLTLNQARKLFGLEPIDEAAVHAATPASWKRPAATRQGWGG